MYLQTFGAVRTVTGSMHLISVNNKKILLDCGLFQGHRENAYNRNKKFPFPVNEIDAVILSHAHMDHSGNLPTLVRQGYRGPVYSTFATRDLCSAMLQDSAYLQEKDIEYINRKREKQGLHAFKPLYEPADVVHTIRLYHGLGFHQPYQLMDGVELIFREAGHILGAAITELQLTENKQQIKLIFTGDIGRKNIPLLPDPYQIEESDILLSESTYGNRIHEEFDNIDFIIEQIIAEAIEKKSKIIIPSFAVDRTQTLVYRFNQLCKQGRCRDIPIYVDSPLATNVTEIYRLYPDYYDKQTHEFIHTNGDPFGFNKLHYIRTVQESMKLNNISGPMIIISASGMCEGGRILHHLKNNIANPNNIILIIGYMAEGTLGKRLVDKHPQVNIFGEPYPLNAKVMVLNAFSGHADKTELLDWISNIRKKPNKIILVHGDEKQSTAFAQSLQDNSFQSVIVPQSGEIFQL